MTTAEELKQIVSQIEAVDGEISDKKEYRKDLIKAAKAKNIDVKALQRVLRERKLDANELEIHEHTVAQYKLDLGMA